MSEDVNLGQFVPSDGPDSGVDLRLMDMMSLTAETYRRLVDLVERWPSTSWTNPKPEVRTKLVQLVEWMQGQDETLALVVKQAPPSAGGGT